MKSIIHYNLAVILGGVTPAFFMSNYNFTTSKEAKRATHQTNIDINLETSRVGTPTLINDGTQSLTGIQNATFYGRYSHCCKSGHSLSRRIFEMRHELNMSQPTLYRKVKHITNLTIIELVRGVRPRKSAELLKTRQYTVQEVAEMVGYNNIPTFRKHFIDSYGTTPSTFSKDEAITEFEN